MFIFGHLGIGSTIARPWRGKISLPALFVGTILPDLIDKPIYYALVLTTGRHGRELGMLGGTRLFGHTALFLLALLAATGPARGRRRMILAGLAIGDATHLLLDNISDVILGDTSRSALTAMSWPLLGPDFPAIPFQSLGAHLRHSADPRLLACEGLGIALLLGQIWRKG